MYLTDTQQEQLIVLIDECYALGASAKQLKPLIDQITIAAPKSCCSDEQVCQCGGRLSFFD